MLALSSMITSLRLAALMTSLLLAGCVSVDGALEAETARNSAAQYDNAIAPANEILPATDDVLTQDGAAILALSRNPALRARLGDVGLARAEWARAVLPPNPVAELTWFNPDGMGAILDADLRVPVTALLGYPWRRAEARTRYDAAQSRAVLDVIDFASTARLAWVDAVAARERAALAERAMLSANAALVVAEEIDAAGNAPGLDLARQRVMTLSAQAARDDAVQDRFRAEMVLFEILAGAAQLPDRLPDPLPTLDDDAFDAAVEQALANSLLLASARRDAEAAAQAAGYASLDSLLGGAELGAAFDRENGDTETGLSAHFDIPLFGLGHPARAAAQIRARQAADRVIALEAEIRTALLVQFAEMRWAEERAAFMRNDYVPATTQALDATLAQYNAMQVGVYGLLDAFDQQVAAGRAYVDAMTRYHQARIAVFSLMQGGSPQTIESRAAADDTAMSRPEGH
jgi:outer membrane protein, heavy metal efflux system